MSGEKIRVLVVDDSAFMRAAVTRTLASDERIEVVGQAKDGAEAVEKVRELRPDVVTMDFNMPRMNGVQAIQAIFAERPVPILMLSAHTQEGAKETLDALAAGAVDFIPKPAGEVSADLSGVKAELFRKVRAAARSRPRVSAAPPPAPPGALRAPAPPRAVEAAPREGRASFASILDPVVIIAISTGGPAALERVIPRLPATFGRGVLVVQHMPAAFTKALAQRLDGISALTVREAQEGDRIEAGTVLVAPGDKHVIIERAGTVKLTTAPPVNGCRPSADVTLQTAAPVFADRLVTVVMTGMGKDGAVGAAACKAAGGKVYAQDKETCVVYGMPKAVAEMGVVERVLALDDIATQLCRLG